jgi:hypothetical protein
MHLDRMQISMRAHNHREVDYPDITCAYLTLLCRASELPSPNYTLASVRSCLFQSVVIYVAPCANRASISSVTGSILKTCAPQDQEQRRMSSVRLSSKQRCIILFARPQIIRPLHYSCPSGTTTAERSVAPPNSRDHRFGRVHAMDQGPLLNAAKPSAHLR